MEKVRLIVIDSLAYPFRYVDYKDSNSMTLRSNILNTLIAQAYQIIAKHKLAVCAFTYHSDRYLIDLFS